MKSLMNISSCEYKIDNIINIKNLKWPQISIDVSHHRIYHRNFDVLAFITEGSANYVFEGKEHHINAGDVVYLSKGSDFFRPISTKSFSMIYIDFEFDTASGEVLPCEIFKDMQSLGTTFLKLSTVWNNKKISYYSECMSILYSIYSKLIKSKVYSYVSSSKIELINKSVETIKSNIKSDEASVAHLAKEAGMSEVHFRRLFKKLYKCSPMQYIIQQKIERAKELLRYENLSVTDAAYLTGFADSCYFSRIFKSKTGYSPSEYKVKFKV